MHERNTIREEEPSRLEERGMAVAFVVLGSLIETGAALFNVPLNVASRLYAAGYNALHRNTRYVPRQWDPGNGIDRGFYIPGHTQSRVPEKKL